MFNNLAQSAWCADCFLEKGKNLGKLENSLFIRDLHYLKNQIEGITEVSPGNDLEKGGISFLGQNIN